MKISKLAVTGLIIGEMIAAIFLVGIWIILPHWISIIGFLIISCVNMSYFIYYNNKWTTSKIELKTPEDLLKI